MHCSNGEIILYVCLAMTYTTYLHNAPLQHIPLQDALQKWWNNCVCMCSHDIHFLLSYRFVAKHKHFELHCTKGETILYIYIYICTPMTYTTYWHTALLQHTPLPNALHKWWNNVVCTFSHDIHYLLAYRFVATHFLRSHVYMYICMYMHNHAIM